MGGGYVSVREGRRVAGLWAEKDTKPDIDATSQSPKMVNETRPHQK
jgi:hypothetical protein